MLYGCGPPAVRQFSRSCSPEVAESETATFIGPISWSPAANASLELTTAGRPLVYVTMGSSGDIGVLGSVIEAVGSFDCDIVVSTAGRSVPGKVRASSTRLFDYLPGEQVCEPASLLSATGEAPRPTRHWPRGSPLLGIASNMDQFLNMRAVEEFGAGILVRGDRARPERIRTAAQALLTHPAFAARARALAASTAARQASRPITHSIRTPAAARQATGTEILKDHDHAKDSSSPQACIHRGSHSARPCRMRALLPEEFLAKAQTEFDKGNLQAASVNVTNALSSKPNMVEARWLMAQIALKSGDAARAEKDIRVAIQYGLPRATAQLTLVRAILLQGAIDRALAETSIPPNNMAPGERAMLLGLRGQALILNGNAEPARPVLARALEIDPKAITALVGMAILHLEKREYDQVRPWINPRSRWIRLRGSLGGAGGARALHGQARAGRDRVQQRPEIPQPPEPRPGKTSARESGPEEVRRSPGRHRCAPAERLQVNAVCELRAGNHPLPSSEVPGGGQCLRGLLCRRSLLPGEPDVPGDHPLHLGQTEQALDTPKNLHARLPRSSGVRELLGSIQIGRSEYASARQMLESSTLRMPLPTPPRFACSRHCRCSKATRKRG